MIGLRALTGLMVAGWLANALASEDRDVKAGITAYEEGRQTEALEHFDAAQERLGERPEIHLDRGLALLARGETEDARKAFQHASEAGEADIRASAQYELGNLAFDAEDYETAITQYIECLKTRPDHGNAKWNLEVALQRKQEKEKEQEPNEDPPQDTDGEPKDTDGEDQPQDQQDTDSEPQPESDEDTGDQGPEDEGETGGEQDPPQEDPADEGEDEDQQQPQAAPEPMDKVDLQTALEQLDAQDNFQLGKPMGKTAAPEKDW